MQFELILMECKDVTSVMAESTFIKEKRRVSTNTHRHSFNREVLRDTDIIQFS